ncbi:MAG: outer membrane beta-barrel protein [Bdellovibrionota bacterium]
MKKLGLAVAGTLLSLSAFADDHEGVMVGGYVDAGYQAQSVDKVAGATVLDTNGFLVREGAIYLGKKWGSEWEVFGDFSFTGNTQSAITGVGVAQAFIAQNMENGFSWKLGKMDGIFGYYAGRVDSHAHRLTDVGYIQEAYLPAYHLGWMGSYSFSDMLKVSILVANENEEFGTTGTAGATGTAANRGTRSPDAGILVGADFDAFSADLGVYVMTGETGTKTTTGYVVSGVVEGNFEPLNVGVYGVYFKNDADATAPAKDEADFGIGANVGYDVNDQFGANLRVEYVGMNDKDSFYNTVTNTWTSIGAVPTQEVESMLGATIGGNYKFNDSVTAKVDYTYTKFQTKGTGADIDPIHTVNAGVVASF